MNLSFPNPEAPPPGSRAEQLTNELDAFLSEISSLETKHGGDRAAWSEGVAHRVDSLRTAIANKEAELTRLQERAAKIDAVRRAAQDPSNREAGSGYGAPDLVTRTDRDPWDGLARAGSLNALDTDTGLRTRAATAVEKIGDLSDTARERLSVMLDDDKTSESARFVLATGNPAYERAFEKWLRSQHTAAMDSTEEELAAWREVAALRSAFTTSNASALMPLVVDSAVVITNTGTASSVRQYASVKTTVGNTFRAVTSPGISATFKAEGVEASDATPTLTGVDLTVYQGFASVMGSYEIFEDTDISSQLGALFADARINQEADAFVTGSGSGAPYGFVTRIVATTASRVATTTASSFTTASTLDVYRLRDAVPARHRQSPGIVFAGNIAAASVIQQMSPSANGGAFWANLNDGIPASLLGVPFMEATSMSSSMTGASQAVLACVNLRQYTIADRLGMSIQQNHVSGSNGRSTGQWEFTARWRTSGDLLNFDAGRVLRT